MFHVSCCGIWWHHNIWKSENLKFDYLKNEKTFRSQININVADTTFNLYFSCIQDFCAVSNLQNLIKEPTYLKNLEGRTGIDYISSIHLTCFQHSGGFSDFYKVTTNTVFNMFYPRQKHRVVKHRNYRNFTNN